MIKKIFSYLASASVFVFLMNGYSFGAKLVDVEGIRYWSQKNYTRIVIDINKETEYKYHLLKQL